MTKEEMIIEEVIKAVERNLGVAGIKRRDVIKNNGLAYIGIDIPISETRSQKTIATIYIDDSIRQIAFGTSTVEAEAQMIASIFEKRGNDPTTESLKATVGSKEGFLANVHRVIVNKPMNVKTDDKYPHIDFFDLEIRYRVFLSLESSVMVTNELLEYLGLTIEEMDAAAMANDRKRYRLTNLSEMLNRMRGESFPELPMYVVSTDDFLYGASAIADSDYLKEISGYFKGNYIILPSSINELIVLPLEHPLNKEVCLEELQMLVSAVNGDMLDKKEILSDSLYMYDAATEEVQMLIA